MIFFLLFFIIFFMTDFFMIGRMFDCLSDGQAYLIFYDFFYGVFMLNFLGL